MNRQIATFSFLHEAHIAKASLDAANIPAFLENEHTINMQWLYSNAIGGVRFSVPAEFEVEALELINSDFSDQVDQEFNSLTKEKPICPSCGSSELVTYTIGKKPAFLVFLLFGFPLFFYKHGFKCKHCSDIFRKQLN